MQRQFPRLSLLPPAVLLGFTLVWFAVRCFHGLHFMSFGDESGHLIGARAIAAGDRLYRDFIDAHGPLCFMVAHLFGKLFGWREPLDARWATIAFACLAGLSVGTSPILRNPVGRLWAAALFTGLIAAPWLVQALHELNYHMLGGALAIVALAWLVIPALLGQEVLRWQALISGVCLAGMCAAAYSLAPSALLFGASAMTAWFAADDRHNARRMAAIMVFGFAGGCFIILLWLLWYGDVIGYLVFHIINNQVNYSRYSAYGWRVTLDSLKWNAAPRALVQTGAALAFYAGLALTTPLRASLRTRAGALRWTAWSLCMLAVLMLNFRGLSGFQDGSFVVASFAALALGLAVRLAPEYDVPHTAFACTATMAIGLLLTGYEVVDRHALTSPFGTAREHYILSPESSLQVNTSTPIYRRVQQILHPHERLLVLVYNPDVYLLAGFLPIRKFHEYLPWEADYARSPWFGRDRDICLDLAARPPPVIVYDGWKVGGVYDPAIYMACVLKLLARDYIADSVPGVYIRRDRLADKSDYSAQIK